MAENRISVRSFVLGMILCAVFAWITVYFSNEHSMFVTSTQIPVLPYALLVLTVLLINPVIRLARVWRPFAAAEVLVVFTMLTVSAGISTFGLSAQLVPMAGSLFNPAWNNEQSRWNQYIAPFVNEEFFVAERGLQAAAARHLEALEQATRAADAYQAARALTKAGEDLGAARERVERLERQGREDAEHVMELNRAQAALMRAANAHENARQSWELRRPDGNASAAEVARTYGPLVSEYDATLEAARAELRGLEEAAFEKVEQFRSGLGKELRAVPGILPSSRDSFVTYAARLRRLTRGRASLESLAAARRAWADGRVSDFQAALKEAAEKLDPIAGDETGERLEEEAERRLRLLRERKDRLNDQVAGLYQERRQAERGEIEKLERRIAQTNEDLRGLAEEETRLLAEREKATSLVQMTERVREVRGAVEKLVREGGRGAAGEEVPARMAEIAGKYRLFDASWQRFLFGDVPWRHWVRVLGLWGVLIGLTYVVLMAFNVLIFRQWAYNEKLIYPLAEIPEHLAGTGVGGGIPPVFKSGLFWAGFAVSASFLGWNMLCYSGAVPGLQRLDFANRWAPYVQNTVLEGLVGGSRSAIFFTMIGLSFLIPKRISFSLWFFSVLYMAQLLVLVWLGYGANEESFPCEWVYTMNFRTAEGGGALLVFAGLVLFKCRKYILCCVQPRSIAGLEQDEQTELRVYSFLFLAGSAVIIAILWRGMGANLVYAVFFYVVVLVVTIGLIRSVTEGGILGFQAWTGPFHLIKNILGMNKAWTAPSLFAPLMVYHSILFLDIKTFIAPAMANALKIRDDLKLRRVSFHAAILLGILLSAVVAVGVEIVMSYGKGADRMQGWFYTGLPTVVYSRMASMAQNPPQASPGIAAWVGVGAVAMAALLYFRQFVFWLPHPIGFIMLVNPIMNAYWFSILLGWLAKSLVTKYGSKDTYGRIRNLFVGLILGELAIVVASLFLSMATGARIPIDLNRNM